MNRRDDIEKALRGSRWSFLSGICLLVMGIGFLFRLQDGEVAARLFGPVGTILGIAILVSAVRERRRLRRELDEL